MKFVIKMTQIKYFLQGITKLNIIWSYFLFCHHLLTLKLSQTCLNFSLLLNTKDDILKNVGNQTVDGPH